MAASPSISVVCKKSTKHHDYYHEPLSVIIHIVIRTQRRRCARRPPKQQLADSDVLRLLALRPTDGLFRWPLCCVRFYSISACIYSSLIIGILSRSTVKDEHDHYVAGQPKKRALSGAGAGSRT